MTDGQKVYDFVNSDAWSLIKRKLTDKLIAIDSLTNIPPGLSADQKLMEIGLRSGAVSLVASR